MVNRMTSEELEKAKARILELQAQLNATVDRLSENVAGSNDKVDDTYEKTVALLAKIRERRRRKTD